MRRRIGLFVGLALGATLASCERSSRPAEPASVFSHALTEDVSGDYRPVDPARAGGVALESLFIGQPEAFAAWEAGQGGSAPLVLTLSDGRGPVRIGPESYRVTDKELRFRGQAGGGTAIGFAGRLDPGALATARRNLGDRTVVIRGELTVGGHRSPVQLTPWGGD